jgi:hypothetical protein
VIVVVIECCIQVLDLCLSVAVLSVALHVSVYVVLADTVDSSKQYMERLHSAVVLKNKV